MHSSQTLLPGLREDEVSLPARRSGYLPGLDGWRTVAIAGVLLTHDAVHRVGPISTSFFHRFGGYGVELFFAISGLLICTRLLEEEAILGRIDLRGFYIRRVLRIQPAALMYLLAIACLTLVGWIHEQWRYWAAAVFLYRNYLWNGNSDQVVANGLFTGHFWSLAVEEHFYLLLSLLLVSLVPRRRIPVTVLLVALLSLWQHYSVHRPSLYTFGISDRHTDQMLNLLLIPSLLAMFLQGPRVRQFAVRWLHPWCTVLAATCVYLALHAANRFIFFPHWHRLVYSSRPDFMVALCPFLIVSTMLHPRSWTTRLLELRPLRYLGKWSYSLYLWHVLFFFRGLWPATLQPPQSPLLYVSVAPWNYLLSLAFAVLSFYFIEKPLMRLGHRIAPPATPGRDDMVVSPPVEVASGAMMNGECRHSCIERRKRAMERVGRREKTSV